MAATLGTIQTKLLAQIADGEPIELGTLDIPLTVNGFGMRGLGEITIDRNTVVRTIATALEEGARSLRDELKSITHDPHACPEGRSAAQCVLACPHA